MRITINASKAHEETSMVRIPDSRIEYFISEGIPYIDLTCEVLGMGAARGEVASRMAKSLGCEVVAARTRVDGDRLGAGKRERLRGR